VNARMSAVRVQRRAISATESVSGGSEVHTAQTDSPIQKAIQRSPRMQQQQATIQRLRALTAQRQADAAANRTGLPNGLKAGIESLSGMSLDGVKVHYNSPQPAQLNALAYAQGTDIHIGPGQEKHLPHEAWHVVQQAQGRVKPTRQMKAGVPINDESALEREADVMGAKAMQMRVVPAHRVVSAVPRVRPAAGVAPAQLETEINLRSGVYAYGGDEQEIVGVGMRAKLDPAHPKKGSEPGAGVQAGLMGYLKGLTYKRMVRGHLLNGQLGGLGIAANLYPITTQANAKHKNHVENKVKDYVQKEPADGTGRRLLYTVDVAQQGSWKADKPDVYFNCLIQWEGTSTALVSEKISSNPEKGKTGKGAAELQTTSLGYKNKNLPAGWGDNGKGFSSKNSAHTTTVGVTRINDNPVEWSDVVNFNTGKIDLEAFIDYANEFFSDLDIDDEELEEWQKLIDDLESDPSQKKIENLVEAISLHGGNFAG